MTPAVLSCFCWEDKKKWQVGWEEMSGSARAVLRALQLWLVPEVGEYQHLGLELLKMGASRD